MTEVLGLGGEKITFHGWSTYYAGRYKLPTAGEPIVIDGVRYAATVRQLEDDYTGALPRNMQDLLDELVTNDGANAVVEGVYQPGIGARFDGSTVYFGAQIEDVEGEQHAKLWMLGASVNG